MSSDYLKDSYESALRENHELRRENLALQAQVAEWQAVGRDLVDALGIADYMRGDERMINIHIGVGCIPLHPRNPDVLADYEVLSRLLAKVASE
jgi:hypothetical protein